MKYNYSYSTATKTLQDSGLLNTLEENKYNASTRYEELESMTLDECWEEFFLSRERIRQIELKALRKLRHPSRAKFLKPFYDNN